MKVWTKEDLRSNFDAPFKNIPIIPIPESVVEFPASAFIAPCGCTEIKIVTPFGSFLHSSSFCAKHMGS